MTTDVKLYRTLKGKLVESEAQDLVDFIHSETNDQIMDLKQTFVTKEDKAEILRMMQQDKSELRLVMERTKFDLMMMMKQDKLELMNLIKHDKFELSRSIYVSGLIQFLAVVGTILGILAFKG